MERGTNCRELSGIPLHIYQIRNRVYDMKVSVCIAAHSKPKHLERVLKSIYYQHPPFEFETIVVDDGSNPPLRKICNQFPVIHKRIERQPTYRNPSAARNVAYKIARGKIIICQSDDVEHQGNAIETLVQELKPRQFVVGNVFNFDLANQPVFCHGNWHELTGPQGRARRPLLFLGAVWRKDIYAIGGCDEEFTDPGRDDVWFADCLTKGLNLTPHFSSQTIGHHLHHERPADLKSRARVSAEVYRRKWINAHRTGNWCSSRGPWNLAVAPYPPLAGLLAPTYCGAGLRPT